jgi:hypothetical protein
LEPPVIPNSTVGIQCKGCACWSPIRPMPQNTSPTVDFPFYRFFRNGHWNLDTAHFTNPANIIMEMRMNRLSKDHSCAWMN